MIKLFWNTHNQILSNQSEFDKVETSRNHIWGVYHKKNSDKWIYEILKKIKFKFIESEKDLEKNDTIIIVDSSVEKKFELYNRLKILCSKVFLIHLGDETGAYNSSIIYKSCNYVWRSFCLGRYLLIISDLYVANKL